MEILMRSRLQGADTCDFCLPPNPHHIAPLAQSRLLLWKYNFDGIRQAQCQVECSNGCVSRDLSMSQICAALKVTAAKIAAVK